MRRNSKPIELTALSNNAFTNTINCSLLLVSVLKSILNIQSYVVKMAEKTLMVKKIHRSVQVRLHYVC